MQSRLQLTLQYCQCCGEENISFGSGSKEPQIRLSATAPAQAPESFLKYLENYFFRLRLCNTDHSIVNQEFRLENTSWSAKLWFEKSFLAGCVLGGKFGMLRGATLCGEPLCGGTL